MPVLRNVENMNYAEIEKALNELGDKVCLTIHISDISVSVTEV